MNTRNIDLLPEFESAFTQQKWDKLLRLLNPKSFGTLQSEEMIAFPIVAKTAEILTTKDLHVPNNIKIACLKCLGNTCFIAYRHKEYISTDIQPGTCCHELYSNLVTNFGSLKDIGSLNSYPFHSHFPYEGVIEWTTDFIKSCKIIKDGTQYEQIQLLVLSIQFLCNLFSFAYKDNNSLDERNIPKFVCDSTLKDIISNLTQSEYDPLVRVSCIFIHNALKEYQGQSFTKQEKILLCSQLLKSIKGGPAVYDALMYLVCQADVLKNAYSALNVEDRLYLLEMIHNEVSGSLNSSKEELQFTEDMFLFLSERFCKISDQILKTVDSYLISMEHTEIIILLEILGNATCISYIKDNVSLLIHCLDLLKSIHEIGKTSNNYFTSMQKLSDVAQMMQDCKINESKEDPTIVKLEKNDNKGTEERIDLQSHPAFGFKTGLIRIIGNMAYRNEKLQDLVREMDMIPLLLDCCSTDARNFLAKYWAILALRNLCEGNPGNQEIIRNCSRIGVVQDSVLEEMGIALHEDETGRQIGVVPLVRRE